RLGARKHNNPLLRRLARLAKALDPAHWSFLLLERKQYLGSDPPLIVVNSDMVRGHFHRYYDIDPSEVRVVRSATDPDRFVETDRPARRQHWRSRWGIAPEETVAAFVAMNYQLKGLGPLLHALRYLPAEIPFRLLVAGSPDTARYVRLA